MKDKLYVINSDCVVVDEIDAADKYVKLSEGDRVIRKGTIQYLSDTIDIKYKFIKINPRTYGRMAIKYPILNILVGYIGYMDGILSYVNGRKIKQKDIAKLCGVSESTAKRQLKGLMESDVIHKTKDKGDKSSSLVMNPYVAYIGRKIYLSLYDEFKLSELRTECEECAK